MRDIRVGAAQFEPRDNDKAYNLGRIRELTRRAVDQGAEIVSFHECCIPGYTWVQQLSRDQLLAVAEPVPDGPSVQQLVRVAREFNVIVMAGLFERHDTGRQCPDPRVAAAPAETGQTAANPARTDALRIHNCYVTVGPDGFITRFRKLHTFISPHLTPGDQYCVIDLLGCRIGFLICYDNNLPENVRITAMLGAEVIFMPHVTACLPSAMPGRGLVDRALWENRHRDPVRLRQEFDGPKGRGWLMRWLPCRAYENGVYAVFTNPIGVDHDTIKPGLATIFDPFGEVLVESRALEDDVVVGLLTPEKHALSSGRRYLRARRPELYGKLVEPQQSVTEPGWRLAHEAPDKPAGGCVTRIA